MSRVAALGCVVCRKLGLGATPAEVHHIRTGQGRKRASDYDTIPLCYLHHRGQDGIHVLGTKAWVRRFFSELQLLSETRATLLAEDERSGDSSPGR